MRNKFAKIDSRNHLKYIGENILSRVLMSFYYYHHNCMGKKHELLPLGYISYLDLKNIPVSFVLNIKERFLAGYQLSL